MQERFRTISTQPESAVMESTMAILNYARVFLGSPQCPVSEKPEDEMSELELNKPHYVHNIDSLRGLLERTNCHPGYELATWTTPGGDYFCQMMNCGRTFIS